ncbi:hypothetical protein BST33_08235 [Mycolicibacter minnesotensis]|uniref:UspA domain-containing protein n=1 Tax=Mycolicibacter minnesotensis TaxID=1118379 RepID=A0A7I7RCK8_9MYCO|nr:universal stress protein [Mycolicibacter minnesotensis]ORB01639.1 hypothetical protein BST33_08235 [Mycolicibacter minnesotensis]BBY35840.1 universal stress protein [Mycolicibacter minnesotensis]
MAKSRSSVGSVVVGLDASRSAMQAVLWAVDEAIHRQIPVYLLYALGEEAGGRDDAESDTAVAERTVGSAMSMIEALKVPVQFEAQIVRSRPITALLDASRSASMICVGSMGFHHLTRGRIGSTWPALLTSARCPVAVVPRTHQPGSRGVDLILAVVDNASTADDVLELGVSEACLRDAPLRVFLLRHTHHRDSCPKPIPVDGRTVVERRVDHWRRTQPKLDIEIVCDHNDLLNYLEQLQRHITPLQLIVVDPRRPGPLDLLLGVAARAPLEAAGCTVMTCTRRQWL